MEWMLTLTLSDSGSQNADKNILKLKISVLSALQLQAGKDLKPNNRNRADAAPIHQDRYNRHC